MADKLHTLGKTGEKWPGVAVGLMSHATFYGKASTQERVDEVLSTAIEQGCTFWDTADLYSGPGTMGDNERQVGAFLRSHPGAREKVFIATRFVNRVRPDDTRVQDGSRSWCLEACAASLKRLGDAGKIKYIGVSEFTIEQLERIEKVADIDAFQALDMLTHVHNPWTPEVLSNGMLDWCRKNGTAIVAPDDIEAGDWRKDAPRFQGENFVKNLELVRDIQKLADQKGVTSSQITLAWVLSHADTVFMIPGTTSPERLAKKVGASRVKLSEAELGEIDAVIASFQASGDRYAAGWTKGF
ncbi:hypothetical protein OC844_007695 [Tilletia horrida]|nr:hypothetical protein OC844_007695 [Tilletia horrida]